MISVSEMRKADEHAQKVLGIPALILMENAGANAARIVHERFSLEGKRVAVFCGTGNNGGDGLVFARHAEKYGATVSVILLKKEEHIRTSETKINYNIVKNLGIKVSNEAPDGVDIACDAMLGIGLKDEVRQPYKKMIEIFNSLTCKKISLDCPSGIDADTGKGAIAIKPDITITFHDVKKGMNGTNSGEIIVTDIGIKGG